MPISMKRIQGGGYMCFYHDINIFSSLDFRRGIVYGRKEKA